MSLAELKEAFALHIAKTMDVKAPIDTVFESILEEIGHAQKLPDGTPMPMIVEAFPGGRWYRDLGNDAGHLWGHVQVIKPPKLLELTGPLFMSYAATNHVQYKLSEIDGGTRIDFNHRAFGDISPDHRKGVQMGWDLILKRIVDRANR